MAEASDGCAAPAHGVVARHNSSLHNMFEQQRQIFEYFAIIGLPADAERLQPLETAAQECGCRNTAPLAPITDICIIFPSLSEAVGWRTHIRTHTFPGARWV